MRSAGKIKRLFKKYVDDTATPEEVREFWRLLSKEEDPYPLKEELGQLWRDINEESPSSPLDANQLIKDIRRRADAWEKVPIVQRKRPFPVRRIAAAAVALSVICLTYYFINVKLPTQKQSMSSTGHPAEKALNPGSNQAILILANGQTIPLDSIRQGQVAIQGNSQVTKLSNGVLSYNNTHATTKTVARETHYNTLRTPKGGTYKLVLPDGSTVWLNASSSIRFPTAFAKGQRLVEITGEAYFEIESQSQGVESEPATVPFTVKVGSMTVEVLGTHFNIMAYQNATTIKTTLLAGAVKVTMENGRQAKLIPGEQAQISKSGNMKVVKNVNLQKIIAWKSHLFWFDDDNIETVMQQIARWYGMDIEINGNVSQHFTGFIPRDFTIQDVFKVLNKTGKINYEIKGKKIIVSP